MTEPEAIAVVAAVLDGEGSLPSQRRVLLRLQQKLPALDWFRIALELYPNWEPDIDLSEADHDWLSWVSTESEME